VLIYDIEGELFFGAAPELDRYLEELKEKTAHAKINYLVIRLRRTRNPDVVAIEHLERFLRDAEKNGLTVLLAGVRPDLAKILINAGFLNWLPIEQIFLEEDEQYSATIKAVRYAYEISGQRKKENPIASELDESWYYLI